MNQEYQINANNSISLVNAPDPEIKEHEVLIQHTCIGLNSEDYQRYSGNIALPHMPFVPGIEAVGTILKVGSKVKKYQEGERVAYATAGSGSFAQRRSVDSRFLISIPNLLSDELVAGSLYKAMTVHGLIFRVFKLLPIHTAIINGASGGVGHLLIEWAKHLQAKTIAITSSADKAQFAKSRGADHSFIRDDQVFNNINAVTEGKGANVVFDCVGGNFFAQSFKHLAPLGLAVHLGNTGAQVASFDMTQEVMGTRCIFITRPYTNYIKGHRMELLMTAEEIFTRIQEKTLNPHIGKTYGFADIPEALNDLNKNIHVGTHVIKI